MTKQMKQLVKDLRANGYLAEPTKKGHIKVTHPDKKGIVFFAGTPSDNRAMENGLSLLKRTFNYTAPWKR